MLFQRYAIGFLIANSCIKPAQVKRLITPRSMPPFQEHPNLVATKQVTDSVDLIRSLTSKALCFSISSRDWIWSRSTNGECGF